MIPASTPSPALRPAPGRPVRIAVTAAAFVGLAVHLWGLYRDHGPPSVSWFPQADKLEHLIGFGLPCLLVLLALHLHVAVRGRLLSTRAVVVVGGLFVAHAVVSEIVQGEFYTTRSGDPFDALADTVGTLLGLGAYRFVRRRFRTPAATALATGRGARARA